jgi:hypothetical protein
MLIILIHSFNFTDYCGIPPWPQNVPDFPTLSKETRDLNPILLDFYSIFRHGSRSSLRSNCFQNLPEFASQPWGDRDCPYNTIGGHMGLLDRRSPTGGDEESSPSVSDQGARGLPEDGPNFYHFPIHPLPNREQLPGVCHMGQLTQRGILQAYSQGYRIGKYLNQTYPSNSITLKELSQASTDAHRTRETAIGFLSGLLDWMPPSVFNNDNNNNNDTKIKSHHLSHVINVRLPTPLTFADEIVDLWKLSTNVCLVDGYLEEAYGAKGWKDYEIKEWDPLSMELRSLLKQDNTDLKDIYDCTKSHFCHGKSVPPFLNPPGKLLTRLETALNEYWAWPLINHDPIRGAKFMAGGHLYALSKLWADSAKKEIDSKPMIYSIAGHDHGPMMTLIGALKIAPWTWPPYASVLNFEFYLISGVSYMRFIWANEVTLPPYCVKNALNSELCRTDDVLKYLLTVLPSKEQCPQIRDLEQIWSKRRIDEDIFPQQNNQDVVNVQNNQSNRSNRSVQSDQPQSSLGDILTQLNDYHEQFKQIDGEELNLSHLYGVNNTVERSHVEKWSRIGQ